MGAGAGEVPPWLTGRTRARSADHARVACAALGVPAAEVMAKYAVEAAEAGRAHVERFVLANFVATERAAKDASVTAVLAMLRSLYALFRLDQSQSFLRGQYVSAAKAKAIQHEMLAVRARRAPRAHGRAVGAWALGWVPVAHSRCACVHTLRRPCVAGSCRHGPRP